MNDSDIWEAVKKLQGKTLLTFAEMEANHITLVEDTGSRNDRVNIEGRNTKPKRDDIIAAYKLLFLQGYLKRLPDLEWLACPEKQTSSIIFRIIGEIAKDDINGYNGKKREICLK